MGHKGEKNKLCFRAPSVTKKHIKKGKEREIERVINLEKPSLATT
jgi:hypothetical protein